MATNFHVTKVPMTVVARETLGEPNLEPPGYALGAVKGQ